MSTNQNINDLDSNVTPRLSPTDNSHISLVANGKISTLYEHKGHMLKRTSMHDAHQKHDPQIRKYT
jgi:hypothetical protein